MRKEGNEGVNVKTWNNETVKRKGKKWKSEHRTGCELITNTQNKSKALVIHATEKKMEKIKQPVKY